MEASGVISSISDLLSALEGHSSSLSYWYRGQSNEDWSLLPGLARELDGLKREWDLIAKFKQNASLLLTPVPRNDWEWLTIMQHHRVPTRLLDWTESPLVALYFAVTPTNCFDAALWILEPTVLNRVSKISPDYDNYIPNFDDPDNGKLFAQLPASGKNDETRANCDHRAEKHSANAGSTGRLYGNSP